MGIKQTSFIAFLASCLLVTTAFAAGTIPPNVQNVSAAYVGDKLTVQWQAVTDPTIDHYNVYYNRVSILSNKGDFDDYERTKATETSFTFSTVPYKSGKIFVAVLAVNKANIESDSFESEASVQIPVASSASSSAVSVMSSSTSSSISSKASAASSISSSKAPIASSSLSSSTIASAASSQVSSSVDPLILMRARSFASTGVLLEFSKALSTTKSLAPSDFIIVDSSGAQLAINRVSFSGSTNLVLVTAPQTVARVYVLGPLQIIGANDGASLALPLPQLTFFGFKSTATGINGRPPYIPNPNLPGSPTAPADTQAPENPTSLSIKPKIRADGTYDVGTFWRGSLNSAQDLADYFVYTTTDGINFVPEQPVGTTTVTFSHIQPGTFGVKVTARDAHGNESTGVSKVVHLPSSGVGLVGLIALSGAFAGQRTARKRRSI